VRAPGVSKDFRLGDIIDFTIDVAKYTIIEVKAVLTPSETSATAQAQWTPARMPTKSRP
jgi:hypothetical protein